MVDKEKVKLMTKLAMYEQNKGKNDLKMMNFYKSDYVSSKVFKINIILTLFIISIFGINFTMKFIENINIIYKENIMRLGVIYGIIWFVLIICSSIISSRVYKRKFTEASSRIEDYEKMLSKLQEM